MIKTKIYEKNQKRKITFCPKVLTFVPRGGILIVQTEEINNEKEKYN